MGNSECGLFSLKLQSFIWNMKIEFVANFVWLTKIANEKWDERARESDGRKSKTERKRKSRRKSKRMTTSKRARKRHKASKRKSERTTKRARSKVADQNRKHRKYRRHRWSESNLYWNDWFCGQWLKESLCWTKKFLSTKIHTLAQSLFLIAITNDGKMQVKLKIFSQRSN